MYYTYVILGITKGDRKELYIGYTEDLRRRIKEHREGKTITTSKMKNIKLVYYEACLHKKDARKRELQLKTGFGRSYLKKRISF